MLRIVPFGQAIQVSSITHYIYLKARYSDTSIRETTVSNIGLIKSENNASYLFLNMKCVHADYLVDGSPMINWLMLSDKTVHKFLISE